MSCRNHFTNTEQSLSSPTGVPSDFGGGAGAGGEAVCPNCNARFDGSTKVRPMCHVCDMCGAVMADPMQPCTACGYDNRVQGAAVPAEEAIPEKMPPCPYCGVPLPADGGTCDACGAGEEKPAARGEPAPKQLTLFGSLHKPEPSPKKSEGGQGTQAKAANKAERMRLGVTPQNAAEVAALKEGGVKQAAVFNFTGTAGAPNFGDLPVQEVLVSGAPVSEWGKEEWEKVFEVVDRLDMKRQPTALLADQEHQDFLSLVKIGHQVLFEGKRASKAISAVIEETGAEAEVLDYLSLITYLEERVQQKKTTPVYFRPAPDEDDRTYYVKSGWKPAAQKTPSYWGGVGGSSKDASFSTPASLSGQMSKGQRNRLIVLVQGYSRGAKWLNQFTHKEATGLLRRATDEDLQAVVKGLRGIQISGDPRQELAKIMQVTL